MSKTTNSTVQGPEQALLDLLQQSNSIVKGPEGLAQALLELAQKSKVDSDFAAQSHYLLYELATQRSLIKVDPFFISHYDVCGRSATVVLKKSILEFIKNNWGEHGHFEDVSGKEMLARNMASFLAADGNEGRVVLSDKVTTLTHAFEKLAHASHQKESVAKAREGLFFHSFEQEATRESPPASLPPPKSNLSHDA